MNHYFSRRTSVISAALLSVIFWLGCGAGGPGQEGPGSDAVDMADPPCSCTEGTRRCIGTQVQICERVTASCASWGPAVTCSTGMCKDGSCGGSCQDACTAGASRCTTDTQRQICRLTDTGCLDWVQEACPGAQYCSIDQCVDSLPCSVTCPSGYMCARNGVCSGGNPKSLDLNVQVLDVSGSVTLNGAAPMRSTAECSATVNANEPKGYVRFFEPSKGYDFYLPIEPCKVAGTAFAGKLFPGTYRVTVSGSSNPFSPGGPLSDLPTQNYVVDSAFAVSAAVTGKVLNVQVLGAAGSVTLNGAAPVRSTAECSATVNANEPKGYVRFLDGGRGYDFYLPIEPCKVAGTAFTGKLFPGTYRVTVSGSSNPFSPGGPLSDLPTQNYVVDSAFAVSAAVTGKVLNVQVLAAAGSVTLNGATPQRNTAECSTTVNANEPKGYVRFLDGGRGYDFYLPIEPCKVPTSAYGGKLFPGQYRVTVRGSSNPFSPGGPLSDLPTQDSVVAERLQIP